MTEAVTPPNPADPSDNARTVPDPTLLTIDALRREIAMLENLLTSQIGAAESLTAERFHRVDTMMAQFEELRREQKGDTAAAVDAALEAQREATSKMERSIFDQLTALRANFETSLGGVQSTLADHKDRLTAMESVKQGQTEQRTERRQVSTVLVAAASLGVAAFVAVLAVMAFLAGST